MILMSFVTFSRRSSIFTLVDAAVTGRADCCRPPFAAMLPATLRLFYADAITRRRR